jgi:hypothetical protein
MVQSDILVGRVLVVLLDPPAQPDPLAQLAQPDPLAQPEQLEPLEQSAQLVQLVSELLVLLGLVVIPEKLGPSDQLARLARLEFKENGEILDRKDTPDLLVLDKLGHKEILVFGEILDLPAQPAQLDPSAQPDQPEQLDVRAQLDKLVILEIME